MPAMAFTDHRDFTVVEGGISVGTTGYHWPYRFNLFYHPIIGTIHSPIATKRRQDVPHNHPRTKMQALPHKTSPLRPRL
jgi:hypothetical protein